MWVIHSPKNTGDLGLNSGITESIVVHMSHTQNGKPLSLCPNPDTRLKNLRDTDKWSSNGNCLSITGIGALHKAPNAHSPGVINELYVDTKLDHSTVSTSNSVW